MLGILHEIMLKNTHESMMRNQFSPTQNGKWFVTKHNENTPGEQVDLTHIKCRIKTLKQMFQLMRDLHYRSASGWGSNPNKYRVIQPNEDIWDEHIAVSDAFFPLLILFTFTAKSVKFCFLILFASWMLQCAKTLKE